MNVPIANSRVARSLSMQRICELYTTDSLPKKLDGPPHFALPQTESGISSVISAMNYSKVLKKTIERVAFPRARPR